MAKAKKGKAETEKQEEAVTTPSENETGIVEEKKVEEKKTAETAEQVPIIGAEAPIAEEELTETKEAKASEDVSLWQPKTVLGKKVKSGEITSLSTILDRGVNILEPQIVEALVPNLESDFILIGQSRGKFGGGQRRIFKQTQKKTMEGNKPSFSTVAVVGNKNGYLGIGLGKSRETVPAREKAIRKAKLNIFKVARGCGCWECGCKEPHSIPFAVDGKCGSVRIVLKPAPKGKGLVVETECVKLLKLAGIKDVWSKTLGQTKVRNNLINACVDALKKLIKTKIRPEAIAELGYVEGPVKEKEGIV